MDPGNAIAVVGLARCALADGDDHGAYELASRALEIDPENDMARRMEARLSEILATRGEPVTRPEAAAGPGPLEMRSVVTETKPVETGPVAVSTPAKPPSPTPPMPPPPSAKEPAVRKSLFDRLLGR
jgi:alkyl sulfatase BDS1-like metallo-beta-lactamase superfamily hydrolase